MQAVQTPPTAPAPVPTLGGAALPLFLARRIYQAGASYRFLDASTVELVIDDLAGAPVLLSSQQFRVTCVLLSILKIQGGNYASRS